MLNIKSLKFRLKTGIALNYMIFISLCYFCVKNDVVHAACFFQVVFHRFLFEH